MNPYDEGTPEWLIPIGIDLNAVNEEGHLLVYREDFPSAPVVGDKVQLCEPEDGLLHVDAVVERLYERRAAVKAVWDTAVWDEDI
jgi:hypothetical protein